ncbi:hypothetical protein LV475_01435 [Guyparkeria hydrothermalis]|uniref:hypothetical protein n=1 Tax=Guyparkeria TaxID=2035712 RepID=UPI0010AD7E69|nr:MULTISPECIES: hypothetical protein [Guyparkeria]MCL7750269.1 hypothetical protein [Guyparkeria hydrothermalis]TKA88506.1 hypothetical protein FAZ79_10070 [Guyparkeria sp. SB14A]
MGKQRASKRKRLSPEAVLAVGVVGFMLFYFVLPWAVGPLVVTMKESALIPDRLPDRIVRRLDWAAWFVLVASAIVAAWRLWKGR